MINSTPLLYSFRRCPYAIRARMTLHISKMPYNLIEVDLKNKPSEMVKISPSNTVPVLKINDNHVIDESLDIMLYALSQNDPEEWLNLSPKEKEETDFLIKRNDETFKKWLDKYKYHIRFPEKPQSYYKKKDQKF